MLICKIAKRFVVFVCMSVRLSVSMDQLDSHWTDFYDLLYPSIFGKSVAKIQVSLKSDKNDGYCT